MGKRFRVLGITLIMAIMLMLPASVFAATSPVKPAAKPACPTQSVTIRTTKTKKTYKKKTNKTIVLTKKKNAVRYFYIKVVKGAKVVKSTKKLTVKKASSTKTYTKYKVVLKKNTKINGKLTIKKSGYKTTKVIIKQK
ncbi:MAG: hypothetical protein Q4D57_06235 [Clostridia bacterium]|nr:hypothetical protein [Clostridia bacterium]